VSWFATVNYLPVRRDRLQKNRIFLLAVCPPLSTLKNDGLTGRTTTQQTNGVNL